MTEPPASAERQPVDNAAEFAELWMGRDAFDGVVWETARPQSRGRGSVMRKRPIPGAAGLPSGRHQF
jgi:hypothetical protein